MSKRQFNQDYGKVINTVREGNSFLRFANDYGAIVRCDGDWIVEVIYWTGAHSYLSWGSVNFNNYSAVDDFLKEIMNKEDEPELDELGME